MLLLIIHVALAAYSQPMQQPYPQQHGVPPAQQQQYGVPPAQQQQYGVPPAQQQFSAASSPYDHEEHSEMHAEMHENTCKALSNDQIGCQTTPGCHWEGYGKCEQGDEYVVPVPLPQTSPGSASYAGPQPGMSAPGAPGAYPPTNPQPGYPQQDLGIPPSPQGYPQPNVDPNAAVGYPPQADPAAAGGFPPQSPGGYPPQTPGVFPQPPNPYPVAAPPNAGAPVPVAPTNTPPATPAATPAPHSTHHHGPGAHHTHPSSTQASMIPKDCRGLLEPECFGPSKHKGEICFWDAEDAECSEEPMADMEATCKKFDRDPKKCDEHANCFWDAMDYECSEIEFGVSGGFGGDEGGIMPGHSMPIPPHPMMHAVCSTFKDVHGCAAQNACFWDTTAGSGICVTVFQARNVCHILNSPQHCSTNHLCAWRGANCIAVGLFNLRKTSVPLSRNANAEDGVSMIETDVIFALAATATGLAFGIFLSWVRTTWVRKPVSQDEDYYRDISMDSQIRREIV